MVQQHPDTNIFYGLVRLDTLKKSYTIGLVKRVFDPITDQMTWLPPVHSWNFQFPNWQIGTILEESSIAFSPDGQDGYILLLGDLPGQGKDSAVSPILIETHNGGQTWTNPLELNLDLFSGLIDSVQKDTFLGAQGNVIVT